MIGFWVFMLVMDLLVPCTMIVFGRRFWKKPPKNINSIFGYRTSMSMKNRDTWAFAHHYCGRLWFRLGWIVLALSLVPLLAVFGREIETVAMVGTVTVLVQIVPMLASIVPVELALKRTFDRSGKRRPA